MKISSPFPGVVVQQLNTPNKVATDANGAYLITLLPDGPKSLVFNYVGYLPVTLPYTGKCDTEPFHETPALPI
jgi:hypothetical protein